MKRKLCRLWCIISSTEMEGNTEQDSEKQDPFLQHVERTYCRKLELGVQRFIDRVREDEFSYTKAYLARVSGFGLGNFTLRHPNKKTVQWFCERHSKPRGKKQGPLETRAIACPAYITFRFVSEQGKKAVIVLEKLQHEGHDPLDPEEKKLATNNEELRSYIYTLLNQGKKTCEILPECEKWSKERGHENYNDRRFFPTPVDVSNYRQEFNASRRTAGAVEDGQAVEILSKLLEQPILRDGMLEGLVHIKNYRPLLALHSKTTGSKYCTRSFWTNTQDRLLWVHGAYPGSVISMELRICHLGPVGAAEIPKAATSTEHSGLTNNYCPAKMHIRKVNVYPDYCCHPDPALKALDVTIMKLDLIKKLGIEKDSAKCETMYLVSLPLRSTHEGHVIELPQIEVDQTKNPSRKKKKTSKNAEIYEYASVNDYTQSFIGKIEKANLKKSDTVIVCVQQGDQYMVQYSDSDVYAITLSRPHCSCLFWQQTTWPCEHMFALFMFQPECAWESLPVAYRQNHPFVLDKQLAASTGNVVKVDVVDVVYQEDVCMTEEVVDDLYSVVDTINSTEQFVEIEGYPPLEVVSEAQQNAQAVLSTQQSIQNLCCQITQDTSSHACDLQTLHEVHSQLQCVHNMLITNIKLHADERKLSQLLE